MFLNDFLINLSLDDIPWLIMLVVFIASTIFATFGFGDALLSLPFLSMIIGLQKATPLLALSGLTLAVCLVGTGYKHIQWKVAGRLVLGSFIGVPLGVFLLKHMNEGVMMAIVSVLIIVISLHSLLQPSLIKISTDKYAPIFGILGGMLGGAFNTSGPPVVLYGSMRGWSSSVFVGMMQAYFIPTDIFVISGHLGSGLLDSEVVGYFLWCLPLLILAVIIGNYLKRSISVERFKTGVSVLILLSGILMLSRSFS